MIKSKLKEVMKDKGFRVRDLAEKTGFSTATVTNARNGRIVKCRLGTLETMAQALGVRVKDLFDELPK